MIDPSMAVAVVSAIIGAVGTVVGALIQSCGRQPWDGQPPAGGVTEAGLAASRDASPDDRR